jgi:hypothetical protein
VIVYRLTYVNGAFSQLEEQSQLPCKRPKFSVVNDQQLLCATVCPDQVLLWSIFNGRIMHIIDESRVDLVMFDDDMNTIYIAKQNVVSQLSINAVRLRIFNFGRKVTAFGLLGMGFSFDRRLVVAGLSDGSVSIVCTDFESRELVERESERRPRCQSRKSLFSRDLLWFTFMTRNIMKLNEMDTEHDRSITE